MAVAAQLVKELRERAGVGIMDCRDALQAAGGDLERAIEELRKNSALKAAKKAGRIAAQGLLGMRVAEDGRRAALVEVNIETDFAAQNEKFAAFVEAVLSRAFETGEDAASLAAAFAGERERLVQEIGENISLRRAASWCGREGGIAGYLHNDRRKGALVELSASDPALGRDLAMHVTAHDPMPLAVRAQDLDPARLAKERELFQAQAAASGKLPAIAEKMVEGRVRKFLAEVSLQDQAFVKDSNLKVGDLLRRSGLQCRRFLRFELGEGIAVARQDFAAEVAAQIQDAGGGSA